MRVEMKVSELKEIMDFVKAPVTRPDRPIWTYLLVKASPGTHMFTCLGSDGVRVHRIDMKCVVHASDQKRYFMPHIKVPFKGGSVIIDFTEDQVILNYSLGPTVVHEINDTVDGYPDIEKIFERKGESVHKDINPRFMKESAAAFKKHTMRVTLRDGQTSPFHFRDESGDRQIIVLPRRCDW